MRSEEEEPAFLWLVRNDDRAVLAAGAQGLMRAEVEARFHGGAVAFEAVFAKDLVGLPSPFVLSAASYRGEDREAKCSAPRKPSTKEIRHISAVREEHNQGSDASL